MELQLSDEQRLILDSAQKFVAAEYQFEMRRKRVVQGITVDRSTWRTLADLGWFGIGVPEELGGFGASTIENTLIAEALGKGQVLEPYSMCAYFPAQILSAVPDHDGTRLAL